MTDQKPSALRERLLSPLTWHYAGFAVLLVVTIVLAIRLGMDWRTIDRSSGQVLAGKQLELAALEHETEPLRGLDQKVQQTGDQMASFYTKRVPPSYSSISDRIGDLAVKSGVRLTRVQYTQGPPGNYLTEISMDAGISGDYPQIMRFINSLERDQMFFIVRAMSLTGQQGGLVNLRLRLSTWLRPADAAASGLPATPTDGGAESPEANAPNAAPAARVSYSKAEVR